MDPEAPNREKGAFVLNKTKVNEFGFNLSSDNKLYEQLACPFEDDISKGHPLCAKFPDGFLTIDFSFEKVASRLNEQTMIYIFYNVMDERLQTHAARSLIENKFRYHKTLKVWVRKFDGRLEYFDITAWEYREYKGDPSHDNFCTENDFAEK